ncbi:hypothetical protein BVRB_3g059320 [Beta vulgaris subsp. vulgaris]|nr:hypothetical protein BVRB_3g059320 [Beta vulgaris subsp. vulgaris]
MKVETTSERVTLDSDDDDDDDDDDDADSTTAKGKKPAIETSSEGLEPPMKKAKKKIPRERKKG